MILGLDIGTGSVRAGLVDADGQIVATAAETHPTHFPRHGWVEQAPEDWWAGAVSAIRQVLQVAGCPATQIAAIAVCGQMHAPVLLDRHRRLLQARVPLWNDKRAAGQAAALNAWPELRHLPGAINPATPAWPGVKLRWMAETDPALLDRADILLMPKDYINFRLTGELAMDWSEAGSSFLCDPATRGWSAAMAERLGVPARLLPPLLPAQSVLGGLRPAVADITGLAPGTPVLAGSGDFPCAILGSGVTEPGQTSDVTGTSFLLTRICETPLIHPGAMNVALPLRHWGAFAVVDAAGDAIRWAAQVLNRGSRSFAALSAEAADIPAGADGLIFLPYLTGERLGQGAATKAGFVGLTASHQPGHLHRAVMEGVVLAMATAFDPIAGQLGPPDSIIAAAGGARSPLWLQIKADVFGVPVIPTAEAECGLIGAAALASAMLGRHADAHEAARALVRYRPPVMPLPANRGRYAALTARFAEIRKAMATIDTLLSEPLP